MSDVDVFLCYRKQGAQTAKLFYFYAIKHNYPYAIWYSDSETYGNYKTDIPKLVSQAECAVLFLSEDFTRGFLDGNGKLHRPENDSDEPSLECITLTELIEIEKKRQRDPNFRILSVNLDNYTLTEDDARILKSVFTQAGIYTAGCVTYYTQLNTNLFNTRKDEENELFRKLMRRILPDTYFLNRRHQGNFWFGDTQTSVDWIYGGLHSPIRTEDIFFELSSATTPEHERINVRRKHFERDAQNDDMINVTGADSVFLDNTERMQITIDYKIIKYELYRKTIELLKSGDAELHQKIDAYNSDADLFPLPNAMGLAFMVITADDYFVFARRSLKRNIRPGEPDCSIVEGLKPTVKCEDRLLYNTETDDYIGREIVRGFQEEICEEWRADNQVTVYGIVLDKEYAQWNLCGTIRTTMTAGEIQRGHANRRDLYEKIELIPVRFDPENGKDLRQSLNGFRDEGMWDTALAAVYCAIRSMGTDNVDEFIKTKLQERAD